MYYWLTNATKKFLISELRESFADHPYFSKIQVQDRFSFKERPQFALIIKGSSGDRIVLSPQNFVGMVHSYCMLASIDGHKGQFLEWIREDTQALYDNDNVFPTEPGIYVLELLDVDDEKEGGTVIVDVFRSIFDENLITFETGLETEAYLDNEPITKSLRLRVDNNDYVYILEEGVDYDQDGNKITFLSPFVEKTTILADYKVLTGSNGPHTFNSFGSNNSILPGVVLAFGHKLLKGDKCAVVITDRRGPAFNEYGGHYTMSFDIDAIAVKDSEQAEQVADDAVMTFLKKKSQFEDVGLTMVDGPSLGGESEEVYDEEGDEYYFSNSFSISFQTDWSYYEPLPLQVSQVVVSTVYEQIVTRSERRELDIEKFF